MRAMFGLVSLLVVVAIIVMVFRYTQVPVIQTGEKAKDQARQIAGRSQDGTPAMNTFKTEGKFRGGTLEALTVTDVSPGGAMAEYGLQKGDQIISVDGQKIGEISVDDPETAKAMVVQHGFQANLPIVVRRGAQEITLPDRNPSNGTAGAASAPSRTPQQPQDNSLQGQMKNINQSIRIPSH